MPTPNISSAVVDLIIVPIPYMDPANIKRWVAAEDIDLDQGRGCGRVPCVPALRNVPLVLPWLAALLFVVLELDARRASTFLTSIKDADCDLSLRLGAAFSRARLFSSPKARGTSDHSRASFSFASGAPLALRIQQAQKRPDRLSGRLATSKSRSFKRGSHALRFILSVLLLRHNSTPFDAPYPRNNSGAPQMNAE
jgi:hypothetical protein